jgi:tetratricopeptide (TPR) repeat protein
LDFKYQIDYKLKLAQDYQAQGKPLHALQIYESIINDSPECTDAYFGSAELYEQMGNIKPAIDLLENYLESDPENKTVRLFLGQYLLRNAKWEETIDVLNSILPDEEPVVLFFMGYAHFMLNEFEMARINFINFTSNAQQSELIHETNIYLAKTEIKLSNYEKALTYAKKAELMYSNYWELSAIYADIYFNLGMHAHAVSPIEKAIKLNPNEPSIYKLAGKIYFKSGDFIKAERNFLKHIDVSADTTADAYTELAEACLHGNKANDALVYFDLALKIDPDNKYALEGKKSANNIVKNKTLTDEL